MSHSDSFLATIVAGIVLAFVFGLIAHRFKISPLVGYIIAGIACGPYMPGFNADADLAMNLANIGIILLMFGVGLHFSPKELMSVKGTVIPGALCEITLVTLMGFFVGLLIGFKPLESFLFGFALSVASTVVLLRTLEDERMLHTREGRIAVGWLIVEDVAMVLAIVLLPAFISGAADGKPFSSIDATIAITIGKIALFVGLMFLVGTRVLPDLLVRIARMKSRELFTLGVLAIALGIAFAATKWFGASFAFGAFIAGLVLGESEISQKAAEKSLPFRDAFAVLFFFSVGMLFNPEILFDEPLKVFGVLLTIIVGKAAAALLIMLLLRYPLEMGLTIAASLAQIGEFSFILAGIGKTLNVLSDDASDLILAGALLSIVCNPFVFRSRDKVAKAMRGTPWLNAILVRLERPARGKTEI